MMSAEAVATLPTAREGPFHGFSEASRDIVRTVSRTTYTATYFTAYAVVFTVFFVGKVIPKENPVIEGFRDGGRAANDVIDETLRKGRRR
jgi:hypothetical protein